MNKMQALRKLPIIRETIQPLQAADLENVHGGATPASVAVSVSVAASRASSAVCIRAATVGVKYTARVVERTVAYSVAAYTAYRANHTGNHEPGNHEPERK